MISKLKIIFTKFSSQDKWCVIHVRKRHRALNSAFCCMGINARPISAKRYTLTEIEFLRMQNDEDEKSGRKESVVLLK